MTWRVHHMSINIQRDWGKSGGAARSIIHKQSCTDTEPDVQLSTGVGGAASGEERRSSPTCNYVIEGHIAPSRRSLRHGCQAVVIITSISPNNDSLVTRSRPIRIPGFASFQLSRVIKYNICSSLFFTTLFIELKWGIHL